MDRTLWTCLPAHWLDPGYTLNKTSTLDVSKASTIADDSHVAAVPLG